MESILKTCNLVENICLHADPNKDYTIAIIVPALAAINETLIGDDEAKVTPEDCNNNEQVKAKIVDQLDKFGRKNGLEKFELPRKVILDAVTEWTPDSGLVTAAFKIRRRNVYDHYSDAIQKLYA